MPRGRKHFHGLKKVRVRQTWNKYNLYNLSRLTDPYTASRTFFQQKWAAKAQARAYHGEHIREGQWTQMFSRYLPAVVPMDPKVLARDDGAEQGAGRGSGKDLEPPPPLTKAQLDDIKFGRVEKPWQFEPTPYMGMTFHPQERRLDIAIFRALFASSARQARQFVVHGFVKVNGKKMQYPGYLLNPGDMFSVDPEMVLWATGTPERQHRTLKAPDDEGIWYDGEYIPPPPGDEKGKRKRSTKKSKPVQDTEEQIADEAAEVEEEDAEAAEIAGADQEAEDGEESSEKPSASGQLQIHKALISLRKDVVSVDRTVRNISAKRKQDLRALAKDLRKAISNSKSAGKVKLEHQKHWEQWFYDILKLIPGAKIPASIAHLVPVEPADKSADEKEKPKTTTIRYTSARKEEPVSEHMKLLESYPNSKPAWTPRPYMSAFAFIPRYLEVNQNVCSAVYLRHPVARPGLAEVPTPFGAETGLLAFQWYLRRR